MWIEIIENHVYRSLTSNFMDTGTTVLILKDKIILIDLGDGISWDVPTELLSINNNILNHEFNLYESLLRQQIKSIKSINIFYTHYHIDHRCGLNRFLKFYIEKFDENIPVYQYLYQPNELKSQIKDYHYYSNNYIIRKIMILKNSYEAKIQDKTLANDRLNEEFLNSTHSKLKFLSSKFKEKMMRNPFFILPITHIKNCSKVGISLNSSIISIATDPILGDLQNGLLKPIIKFVDNIYEDKEIKVELILDKSHSFDHIIYMCVFKLYKKSLLHIGDIMPIEYALNDCEFSNRNNLVRSLQVIKDEALKSNKNNKIIVTISHPIDGRNVFSQNFITHLKEQCKSFESKILDIKNNEETKFQLQRDWIRRNENGLNDLIQRIGNIF